MMPSKYFFLFLRWRCGTLAATDSHPSRTHNTHIYFHVSITRTRLPFHHIFFSYLLRDSQHADKKKNRIIFAWTENRLIDPAFGRIYHNKSLAALETSSESIYHRRTRPTNEWKHFYRRWRIDLHHFFVAQFVVDFAFSLADIRQL